jgi:hypothetical protein
MLKLFMSNLRNILFLDNNFFSKNICQKKFKS